MRIAFFIGFIVAYIVFLALSFLSIFVLFRGSKRELRYGDLFIYGQLSVLLWNVAFFGYLFLLAGLFSPLLAVLFIAGSEIGALMTAVAFFAIGSRGGTWPEAVFWTGVKLQQNQTWWSICVGVLAVIILVAYPVVMGVVVFGHQRPSPELTRLVLGWTLGLLVFATYPLVLINLLRTEMSDDLDEHSRLHVLISNTTALVPMGLYIALTLSAIGISGPKVTIGNADVPMTVSSLLLVLLIGFYVVTALIPFAIGAQRAKRWRLELLDKRRKWLTRILEALEVPVGEEYLPKTEAAAAEIRSEISAMSKGDPNVASVSDIDPELSVANDRIQRAFLHSQDTNARLQYVVWLRRFADDLDDLAKQLSGLVDKSDLQKTGEPWTNVFRERRDEIDKERDDEAKAKTPAVLIWGAVFSPIFGIFVNGYGNVMWQEVQRNWLH